MRFRNLIPSQRSRTVPVQVQREPVAALHDQMNRLFDNFFSGFDMAPFGLGSTEPREGLLRPELDVAETEEELRVEVELPGVDEKDLNLSLSDGLLTISGEKRTEETRTEDGARYTERSFGKFERSLALPCEVDSDKVEATFKKGVLTIRLPKSETAERVKQIEVRSGD